MLALFNTLVFITLFHFFSFAFATDCYYFAYGSNMDSSRMKLRMENGPQVLIEKGLWEGPPTLQPMTIIGPAILENYDLDFSKIKSTSQSEGFATIFPSAGQTVEGVLYLLNEWHLKVLDYYEGFKGESNELNHYDRAQITVEVPTSKEPQDSSSFKDSSAYLNGLSNTVLKNQHCNLADVQTRGARLQATVYIAHPSKIDKNRKPSKEYLGLLLRGAREFSLSPQYILKLEQTSTVD